MIQVYKYDEEKYPASFCCHFYLVYFLSRIPVCDEHDNIRLVGVVPEERWPVHEFNFL